MGTPFDPNHPARPRDVDEFVQAYRNHGEEAPWLLAWKDGAVLTDPVTGRYVYEHEVHGPGGDPKRGRGGKRH